MGGTIARLRHARLLRRFRRERRVVSRVGGRLLGSLDESPGRPEIRDTTGRTGDRDVGAEPVRARDSARPGRADARTAGSADPSPATADAACRAAAPATAAAPTTAAAATAPAAAGTRAATTAARSPAPALRKRRWGSRRKFHGGEDRQDDQRVDKTKRTSTRSAAIPGHRRLSHPPTALVKAVVHPDTKDVKLESTQGVGELGAVD